jgi:hypothetical protein
VFLLDSIWSLVIGIVGLVIGFKFLGLVFGAINKLFDRLKQML